MTLCSAMVVRPGALFMTSWNSCSSPVVAPCNCATINCGLPILDSPTSPPLHSGISSSSSVPPSAEKYACSVLSRLILSYPEMVLGPFQAACFGPADYYRLCLIWS